MAHRNALNWFEIPVSNLDRAQKFYETLLGMRRLSAAADHAVPESHPAALSPPAALSAATGGPTAAAPGLTVKPAGPTISTR